TKASVAGERVLKSRRATTTSSAQNTLEASTSTSPRLAANWPTPPLTTTSPLKRRTIAARFHQRRRSRRENTASTATQSTRVSRQNAAGVGSLRARPSKKSTKASPP